MLFLSRGILCADLLAVYTLHRETLNKTRFVSDGAWCGLEILRKYAPCHPPWRGTRRTPRAPLGRRCDPYWQTIKNKYFKDRYEQKGRARGSRWWGERVFRRREREEEKKWKDQDGNTAASNAPCVIMSPVLIQRSISKFVLYSDRDTFERVRLLDEIVEMVRSSSQCSLYLSSLHRWSFDCSVARPPRSPDDTPGTNDPIITKSRQQTM